jgi:type VI secretion system secreted protein Hcp
MAFDTFIRIDSIQGESADAAHPGEIEVYSFSWGESNPATATAGSGFSAGKVSVTSVDFMTKFSKASPLLMRACATGQHLKTALISCRKSGVKPQDFLRITLTDVLVSSYQTSASSGGDDVPTDSVALGFAQIQVDYRQQQTDGSLGASTLFGWNQVAGKAV